MAFEYLSNIPELKKLYETLIGDEPVSNAIAKFGLAPEIATEPFFRCIEYGKRLENLIRYVYSKKLDRLYRPSYELIKLIKEPEFKKFLGKTEYYNKVHFIFLAANNAAYDHGVDQETADLALENLKEVTYLLFEKSKFLTQEETVLFKYVPRVNNGISEAKTREIYIDTNLRSAKYKINKDVDGHGHGHPVPDSVCVEIEIHDLPNQAVGYADYVIYNKIGLPVAVIEAKKTSVSIEAGAQQARDYADALQKNLNLPYRIIVYYTNGYEIRIQDRLGYPARTVGNFASLADLELMIKRQLPGPIDKRKPIALKEVNESIINRSKLIEATKELIESMDVTGQMRRKGLLVLPCGVGKTRTAVALCEILIKNDWVQNVLFLADRNNLVTNALKPFKEFMSGVVSDISAENPDRDLGARVCVCTYNSMLNYLNKPDKPFSVGHFDIIIVDEAHRSLFNVYRAIFDYFDSFLIGLTATPSKALDKSTYEILDLPVDQPTFEVKFEEAVNLGYLVAYKAFDKTSQIIKDGVKYDDLTDDEKLEYEALFGVDGSGDPVPFVEGKVFLSYIFNKDTINKMFDDLFAHGLRVENGTKIGKTLIFARDHEHAVKIAETFKANPKYAVLGDDFCQVIDNQIKKNKTRQDNFAKKDSNPQIVVSVDMMDTGVDIPEIVNLVFFKRVLSRIKFDQMWGRGTRTCKGLRVITPPRDYFEGRTKDDTREEYMDKQGFFVFDYCGNFDFFNEHPEGVDPSNTININQKLYCAYLDILSKLETIEYQEKPEYRAYYQSLRTRLKAKITSLDKNRLDVKAKLYFVDLFSKNETWDHLSQKKLYDIKTNLVKLIDQDTLDDVYSASFDYRVAIIQLSLLDKNVDSKKQQIQVMGCAAALLRKASIADIYAQKDLLKELAKEEYYDHLDFLELEEVKRKVGPLIKYLRGETQIMQISNFNDKIETKERASAYDFDDFKSYREKFISYLQLHFGELESVKKIIALEELNSDDLKELQSVLDSLKKPDEEVDEFGSAEELIVFIRKIVGLDRTSIDEKCAKFINENSFSREQRQLINLVIDFAIRNGNVTPDDLVNNEPFCEMDVSDLFNNDLAPILGILSVFNNPLQVRV